MVHATNIVGHFSSKTENCSYKVERTEGTTLMELRIDLLYSKLFHCMNLDCVCDLLEESTEHNLTLDPD